MTGRLLSFGLGVFAGVVWVRATEAPRVIRAAGRRVAEQMREARRQADANERLLAAIPEPSRSAVRAVMAENLRREWGPRRS